MEKDVNGCGCGSGLLKYFKPYDKFDDELFIDYDSIKPLATLK